MEAISCRTAATHLTEQRRIINSCKIFSSREQKVDEATHMDDSKCVTVIGLRTRLHLKALKWFAEWSMPKKNSAGN